MKEEDIEAVVKTLLQVNRRLLVQAVRQVLADEGFHRNAIREIMHEAIGPAVTKEVNNLMAQDNIQKRIAENVQRFCAEKGFNDPVAKMVKKEVEEVVGNQFVISVRRKRPDET